MNRQKLIVVVVLLLITIIGVRLFSSHPAPQVVGNIAPDDLTEILHLIRKDLRALMLPKAEWDNVFHPRYVVGSIRDYHAQRILWAEARAEDGTVNVFAGVDRKTIRDTGHLWSLQKNPTNWTITGYAYWGFSNVAPADMHVPAPN